MLGRRRSVFFFAGAFGCVLAAFSACADDDNAPRRLDGGTVPTDGASGDAGAADARADAKLPPPTGGRVTATACAPRVRDAGVIVDASLAADSGGNTCASDDECDVDAGYRCDGPACAPAGALGTRCTRDVCQKDDDCGSTAVCGCGLGVNGVNVCLSRSNCRTNADCASGQICGYSTPCTAVVESNLCSYCNVPVLGGDESGEKIVNAGGVVGYFCTTPDDECRPGDTPDSGQTGRCAYFPARKLWAFDNGP